MTKPYRRHEQAKQPAGERIVAVNVAGESLSLRTASGVFGAQRVDHGTMVLLRNAPSPAPCSGVVDVGTGYGPIAVTMGLRQPDAGVWAVDVNRRALDLARGNAMRAGALNVVTSEPAEVPEALRFDRLYSNPPIKIGRDRMLELLTLWLGKLAHGADAYLAIKQAMGADRLHRWLNESGYPTDRAASKQGYRLLRVAPRATHQPPPDALTPRDLTIVNSATGQRWSVLGRLSGGATDSVQLLGSGAARAVVKLKHGAWWGGQLERAAEIVTELRAAGYPTAPVLGFGALGADRFFLATEFTPGTMPTEMGSRLCDEVLAAVGLHAAVHPPEVRDWSAMITRFLNGGITEHRFHPQLAGLAHRALALVPHPVPALPSGDFVHGDFSTRNVLVRDGRLSSVIDIEGFGRGTRTIDLVALLASIHSSRRGQATSDRVVEHAIAASDEQTFQACLAHRVLAWLLSATERPDRVPAVAERATALLAIAA